MNYKKKVFEALTAYYDREELLYHVTEPENGAPAMIAMIHEDMTEMGNEAAAMLFFLTGLEDDEPAPGIEGEEGAEPEIAHLFNIFIRFGDTIPEERIGDLATALAFINNYTAGGLFVMDVYGGMLGFKHTLFLSEKAPVDDAVNRIDAMHSLAYMTCGRFMDSILDLVDGRTDLEAFLEKAKTEIGK